MKVVSIPHLQLRSFHHGFLASAYDSLASANDRGHETPQSPPHTVQAYVDRVAAFAKHFGRSPQFLGPNEVRAYLVFLVEEKRVS